jgi:hypothetical protein
MTEAYVGQTWQRLAAAIVVAGVPVLAALLTSGLVACGSASNSDGAAAPDASAFGLGANDGGTIVVIAPPSSDGGAPDGPCDPTGEPSTNPCALDSQYGVFVSPAGTDSASGTKADPLKTIGEGIANALLGTKRVFVCAGTYDEHIVLGANEAGISVYGGFDCAQWVYDAMGVAKIAPSTPGYALEVDLLATQTTFEDFEFDAQSAQTPGASSIAVFANQSIATFRRVTMNAGDGATGADGDAGNNYAQPYASDGNNADGGTGAPQMLCSCANGDQSIGGAGGSAGPPTQAGESGLPPLEDGMGGASGGPECNGKNGSPSSDAVGVLGASNYGQLSAGGWTATSGNAGNAAPVAQGGGGGGGTSGSAGRGGGGAGGCGGCGGGGGAGGLAGGSSFALLSYQSTVDLTGDTLAARNAGNGGSGGPGQLGQSGGFSGQASIPGCQGATGGRGGNGSGGGGGAGGLAIAIGYVGVMPVQDSALTKVGYAGFGGEGGVGAGFNNPGGKGRDGVAMPVLEL